MKSIKFLDSKNGIDFFLFKPSLFKLYYPEEKGREEPVHRYTFTHRMHMLKYLFFGGYQIIYLFKNSKVVSYIVFCKSNKSIVKGSSRKDYYTIFLWTYPEFRGNGYATLMAQELLKYAKKCRKFYKTIAFNNFSSIKVAESVGFKKISEANKIGLFHKIVPAMNGSMYLYCLEKNE